MAKQREIAEEQLRIKHAHHSLEAERMRNAQISAQIRKDKREMLEIKNVMRSEDRFSQIMQKQNDLH